ncbi:MAG: MBOAT family O-acyltransferase [Lachnospiraceae bacterium]
MIFSSIPFLFYFLPLVILLYFLAPEKLKNAVLLFSSLFFYAWGEPRFLVFMVVSILQGYVCGLLIERYSDSKRSKVILAVSVSFSLLLLGYCKYTDFFITNFHALTGMSVPLLNIALPIGISFYTFQILSYTVDVYRKNVPVQKNLIDFAAYAAMFPQLIAGPIVRYADIAPQLKKRTHSIDEISLGIRRFVLGLSKKILLANTLAQLVDIYKASNDKSLVFAWIYAIAYTLHVYFDFSGYSDMAIGLGHVFGFQFPENFNYPYISRSITEFWRRWHMTLGSWFRDYLYIPLGGNRVSRLKWIFNILIVWMATGFWHGASWNFILWGLYFAILLVLEKMWLLRKLPKSGLIPHLYVMFFVLLSFVFFDSPNVPAALATLGSMFGFAGLPLISTETQYYLSSYAILILIGLLGSTPFPAKAAKKWFGESLLEPAVLLALLAVCSAFLIDGSFNPFLYFRF